MIHKLPSIDRLADIFGEIAMSVCCFNVKPILQEKILVDGCDEDVQASLSLGSLPSRASFVLNGAIDRRKMPQRWRTKRSGYVSLRAGCEFARPPVPTKLAAGLLQPWTFVAASSRALPSLVDLESGNCSYLQTRLQPGRLPGRVKTASSEGAEVKVWPGRRKAPEQSLFACLPRSVEQEHTQGVTS